MMDFFSGLFGRKGNKTAHLPDPKSGTIALLKRLPIEDSSRLQLSDGKSDQSVQGRPRKVRCAAKALGLERAAQRLLAHSGGERPYEGTLSGLKVIVASHAIKGHGSPFVIGSYSNAYSRAAALRRSKVEYDIIEYEYETEDKSSD